jgi:hypothetical protein
MLSASAAGMAAPRGVDMNLDKFDVSAPARADPSLGQASSQIGRAFWASVDSDASSVFTEQDKHFFKDLFNPTVCDRRDEGDVFTPPDTRLEYMEKLQALIKEEAETRQQRTEAFLSESFDMDKPGALFPSSWTAPIALVDGASKNARVLCARPDYISRSEHVLKSATAKFDKTTEDGTRFRIYHTGTLEVRTTQEHGGKEVIGVVFSVAASKPVATTSGGKDWNALKNERVVSVTQHVEGTQNVPTACRPAGQSPGFRFYLVLETESAAFVVMEKLGDGSVAWVENPKDLEARNSFAKVTRSVDCRSASLTVQDLKSYHTTEAHRDGSRTTHLDCKLFTDGACDLAAKALPEKVWQKLTDAERQAARDLGIEDGRSFDGRTAKIFHKGWTELTSVQIVAAKTLGFDRSSWALFV